MHFQKLFDLNLNFKTVDNEEVSNKPPRVIM